MFAYKAQWLVEKNSVVFDLTEPRQGGQEITDEEVGSAVMKRKPSQALI